MRDAKAAEKSEFFGLPLDLRGRRKLCADIRNALAGEPDCPSTTCFRQHSLNAVKLPGALRDGALFGALARADCLSADGMGIVWAARMMGISVPERVTGIDLMTDLLGQFAQDRVRVFLLGARQEVLDRLCTELPQRFPGLIIAGAHHGYEMNDQKLADCVALAKADAVFVALPSPRKEVFVDRFAPQTGCRFAMGVGGAFDVLAGKVKRAPVIWQRAGAEFLWRIACQPRYMIPRYARGLSAFTRIVLPEIAKAKRGQLRRTLHKIAVTVALMPVGFAAFEGRAQTITPDRFELTNQQAATSWIEDNIAGVKDPEDLGQLIDQLVDQLVVALLSEEAGSETPTVDWQATEANLKTLLGLFELILGETGANRFLLEVVLGGVVAGLTDMHPSPAYLENMVAGAAPDLAERMFGPALSGATHVVESQSFDDTTAQDNTAGFIKGVLPPEIEMARRYSLLFTGGRRNQPSDSLWSVDDFDEREGELALEDASPR